MCNASWQLLRKCSVSPVIASSKMAATSVKDVSMRALPVSRRSICAVCAFCIPFSLVASRFSDEDFVASFRRIPVWMPDQANIYHHPRRHKQGNVRPKGYPQKGDLNG